MTKEELLKRRPGKVGFKNPKLVKRNEARRKAEDIKIMLECLR